jgi:hypothetical protein
MAAAARLLLRRATSAVAEAAVGRPSLPAPARRPGLWAAMSAAVVGAPGGAAPSSDIFSVLGNFGVPTALVVATTTGAFLAIRQFGELSAKVAASDKAIAAAATAAEVKMAANKESAASAVAAAEAKMAANKEVAASAVAAAEAKMAANKEVAACAVAAAEAKLAAAEKVIAAMMAGVPVASELAALKAQKRKEEAPKGELKEQGH